MVHKVIVILACLLLAGCSHSYWTDPGEDYVSTIPVTNNPNAMPGINRTTLFPSVF